MTSDSKDNLRRHGFAWRRRGQSLIVSVIVMFVLLFLRAIFVGLVPRNLSNSGRARETLSAQSFAEAGIRYCDYYLMNSPEGADWRPAPEPPPFDPRDPDLQYLNAGYTRIPLSGGRALVRVSYGPRVITD